MTETLILFYGLLLSTKDILSLVRMSDEHVVDLLDSQDNGSNIPSASQVHKAIDTFEDWCQFSRSSEFAIDTGFIEVDSILPSDYNFWFAIKLCTSENALKIPNDVKEYEQYFAKFLPSFVEFLQQCGYAHLNKFEFKPQLFVCRFTD